MARLVHAADRVAGGDLDARVETKNDPEEIAVLSRAFNRMTGDLQDQQKALRQANADKFQTDNQLTYKPSQIIVSNGAKHSCYNAILASVQPGDEVIIHSPYWLSYPEMVRLAGGDPVPLANALDRVDDRSPRVRRAGPALHEIEPLIVGRELIGPAGISKRRLLVGEGAARHAR